MVGRVCVRALRGRRVGSSGVDEPRGRVRNLRLGRCWGEREFVWLEDNPRGECVGRGAVLVRTLPLCVQSFTQLGALNRALAYPGLWTMSITPRVEVIPQVQVLSPR